MSRISVTNRESPSSHVPVLENGIWALADSHAIFVRNLRFWLGTRNMKAAELSRRLGKDASACSHWLAGKAGPDVWTIGRVAEILEIPLPYLFFDGTQKQVEKLAASLEIDPPPVADDAEDALRTLAERAGLTIGRIQPKKNN